MVTVYVSLLLLLSLVWFGLLSDCWVLFFWILLLLCALYHGVCVCFASLFWGCLHIVLLLLLGLIWLLTVSD